MTCEVMVDDTRSNYIGESRSPATFLREVAMMFSQVWAIVCAVGFVGFSLRTAAAGSSPVPWWIPSLASAGFFGFSLVAVLQEGPTGFWVEHTQHLWGNQIWMDLLFAATVGWSYLAPRLRRFGMNPIPWVFVLAATGSIGMLGLWSRVLWLEQKQSAPV